jgi:ABC-type antimicrobial peptide transport system permease subunit
VYAPLLQGDYRSATLELRIAGSEAHVFNDLRAAARQVDSDRPLFDLRTMEAQIAGTLSPERMLAVVSAAFGALALLLAVVGLYGVLAYAVARRTREIGIRMALGAAQGQVVGAVLRDAFLMAGAGLFLGVPLSLLASRWIASFLYGLKPGDPATYIGVVVVLSAAAAAAAIIPSRRASRVDPMIVLRWE